MNDSELASQASRTLDALRTNTNFPDMTPTFAEYEPKAQDYIAKQAVTANRRASTQQNREKDESREELLRVMRAVAGYVNNFTQISSVQLSSGFLPVSDPRGLQAPRASGWTRIRQSNRPAEILLEYEAIREAYQYERQIASELDAEGQPIWQPLALVSDSRGNYYTPVVDGTTYYFRVRSLNKRGVSAWSPVATRKVWVD